MRILVDIGHPAHVHYFRNFIKIMTSKGHQFMVTARDKEVTHELLNAYGIRYVSRGKGGHSLIGKLAYIAEGDYRLYRSARRFRPELFLSFASTYAAHASRLYGKPHIAIDDTEHSKFELLLYPPFSETILTPSCFTKKLGPKQIFFDSFTEMLYLHPDFFNPNPAILDLLNVRHNDRFAIVRFVSWNASHDANQRGLSVAEKEELVQLLSQSMKVFVSSEGTLPRGLAKYQFSIPPHYMHHALAYASIYVGEGATTASEAALLGTPAVYVNSLTMGYIEEEAKAGILFRSTAKSDVVKHISKVLADGPNSAFKQKSRQLIRGKINPTNFLVWFVENYPASFRTMKENPKYQYNFK